MIIAPKLTVLKVALSVVLLHGLIDSRHPGVGIIVTLPKLFFRNLTSGRLVQHVLTRHGEQQAEQAQEKTGSFDIFHCYMFFHL